MRQISGYKKFFECFMGGVVIISLFFLSACNGRSSEEAVKTWQVMGHGLEQKQIHLNAIIAAEGAREWKVPGGDPERGVQAFRAYGCTSCHTIPGVRGANSLVGPPLTRWAERGFIAGNLPNTPYNLVQWIRYPQRIEPGTVMPDLDVSEQDARDMAAYLFTLGGN